MELGGMSNEGPLRPSPAPHPSAAPPPPLSPAAKPEFSSTTSPRISCPITNGGEVRGEKYGELSADRVPRSEPQIPDRSGRTRLPSGLTTMGLPTASSIGRSEIESAYA